MLNFREDNNFIIINEKAFVPGKGKGPFVKPFQASGSQIRLFRRLGLHVTIVDEDYEYPSSKKEDTIKEENKKDSGENKDERNSKSNDEKSQEEQSIGEESSRESKVDDGSDQDVSEKIDDKAEEKVEEAESEKEEEETTEESKEEEVKVTEEDLNEFTVAELKEELDSKEIEYANNARKKDLIDLLLQNQ